MLIIIKRWRTDKTQKKTSLLISYKIPGKNFLKEILSHLR